MASNRVVASLSVGGVIGGIALTIYLTQTLLSPLIEKAQWFPDNGIFGIGCWLLLYIVLALLLAPASFHKFISGVLFGFWGGWAVAFVGACLGAILPFWLTKNTCMAGLDKR